MNKTKHLWISGKIIEAIDFPFESCAALNQGTDAMGATRLVSWGQGTGCTSALRTPSLGKRGHDHQKRK